MAGVGVMPIAVVSDVISDLLFGKVGTDELRIASKMIREGMTLIDDRYVCVQWDQTVDTP